MISMCTSSSAKEDVVFPRVFYCDSRCSQTCRRRFQVCCRHSQVIPGLLSARPCLSPVFTVTVKATRNALLGSDTLLKLMHLSLPSTSSQIILYASSDLNTLCWCGVDDPWNPGLREWDQKLGKAECVFSFYHEMRWKWDDIYRLQGLPNIYSISLCPPLFYLNLCTSAIDAWRCTSMPWSTVFRDVLVGRDQASLEMYLDTKRSSELRHAHGGPDWWSSEIHLEAKIGWTQWCTGKLRLSALGNTFGGSESGGSESGGGKSVRMCHRNWEDIHWLNCTCGNVENWVQHDLLRDDRLAGSSRQSILIRYSMRCMQYSGCAVLSLCCTRC